MEGWRDERIDGGMMGRLWGFQEIIWSLVRAESIVLGDPLALVS